MRLCAHLLVVVLLTALTQLGGLAWLAALGFRRRVLAFATIYAALSLGATAAAPALGRVPLPCGGEGPLRMQSWISCLANRRYVAPELKAVAEDLAEDLATRLPGTLTLALDGSFPFLDGFPLLPHLSHDDGRKLDLALFYADATGYLPGATRSPVGYFAFEEGPTECPKRRFGWRWDLAWAQPLMKPYALEPLRLRAALDWLARDARVRRVFLEPHLVRRLGASSPKLRFQGCGAARHDDHIHIEI